MERDKAITLMRNLLKLTVDRDASDLFVTVGFPPAIKVNGEVAPVAEHPLTEEEARMLVYAIMNDRQTREFDASKECNFAISPDGIGRFRVNAYIQQGHPAAVLRTIQTEPPTVEGLSLPPIFEDVVMIQRGLVIVVGATGSGKSTTLAAMIDHRNRMSRGHIVTIEDPIEFVHVHKQSIVSQREVGIDTEEWQIALKNVLRQAPNVVLIGEIRDRGTMETALQLSETGHLALATLHANSSDQAIDRILNFFPAPGEGGRAGRRLRDHDQLAAHR
jgi:twitching motility protein PilU